MREYTRDELGRFSADAESATKIANEKNTPDLHQAAAKLHRDAMYAHRSSGDEKGFDYHHTMQKLHDKKAAKLEPKKAKEQKETTEHPLYAKLQSDSARPMIPEAKRQFNNDPDKDLIAERGKFVSGEGKSKMLGAEGECHWNTAKLFRDEKIDAVVVGYAHNPEAGWHQHTWGEKGGKIVETTASNLSSTRYFGAKLSKEESARFSEWAIKNPPGGGVVRSGKKGKL